ncbi:fibronectin type III domain-containing protein, partial [Rhizobium leguminosarum]|uniref:fibronectin type III domain-containing protein n=1 Tax=Rhizobium leguminosarum TaxID=384 RepID=UPI003F946E09
VKAVPVNGTAAGSGVVKVSWTAPRDNGSPIESYIAYGDNGTACAVSAQLLSCDMTGLTGGAPFAIKVTASNDFGEGPASQPVPVTLLT